MTDTSRVVTFTLKVDASGMAPGAAEGKAAIQQLGKAAADVGKEASGGLAPATRSTNDLANAAMNTARTMSETASVSTRAAAANRTLAETAAEAEARYRSIAAEAMRWRRSLDEETAAKLAASRAEREVNDVASVGAALRRSSASSFDATAASARSFMSEASKVTALMESEAKTLDDVAQRRSAYAAAMQRGIITETEHTKALADLERQESRVEKAMASASREVDQLLKRYAPSTAALRQVATDEEKLRAARDAGTLSLQNYQKAMAGLTVTRAQWEQQDRAVSGAASALERVSFHGAGAKREIGVLVGELARGNFAALEGSMITLANRSGVLSLALSGVGIAIGLAVAAVGLLGYTAIASEQETRGFEKALIESGNHAGVSSGQLRDMASALGETTGRYSKATEALTVLTASGKFAGDALNDAARAAVAISEITGKSIDQAVSQIERLGGDPTKAIAELNDKYHFLTLSVYDHIKALEDQGRQEEATSLAVQTAAESLDARRQAIVDTAGSIEKAWRAVSGAVKEAIDNLKQVGRTDTEAQLRNAYAKQFDIDQARADMSAGGVRGFLANFDPTFKDKIDAEEVANKSLIAGLQERMEKQRQADEEAARQTALHDNAIKAAEKIDALTLSMDKQLRKQHEIQALNANFSKLFADNASGTDARLAGVLRTANGGFSGGLYDRLLGDINSKYEDKGAARQEAEDNRTLAEVKRDVNRESMDALGLADRLAAGYRGPWAQAQIEYAKTLEALGEGFAANRTALHLDMIDKDEYTRRWNVLSDAVANAGQRYEEAEAAVGSADAVLSGALATLKQETQAHNESGAAVRATSLARQFEEKLVKDGLPYRKEQIKSFKDEAQALLAIANAADYARRLQGDVSAIRDEIDAHGDLTPIMRAELEIRKLGIDSLIADREERERVKKSIRDSAAELQGLQSIQALGNDLSNVFRNAIQSIANGGSAFDSLRDAAVPALDDIGKRFRDIIEKQQKTNAGTVDWGKALGDLKDGAMQALPVLGQLVGTIAGGGGQGGAQGSAIGSMLGGIVGTIFPVIGTAVGAAIGGLLGGVIGGDGEGPPRIYGSSIPTSVSRRGQRAADTPLGIIAVDTDNLADDAYAKFADTIKNFDIQLAKLLSPDQLKASKAALEGWSGKFSDIESLLQSRFDVILGTFGKVTEDFVNSWASDLQGRVQALADVLSLQKLKDSGRLILDSLDDVLTLITEFGRSGERIVDAYQRIAAASEAWDQAQQLMGFQRGGSRIDNVRYAVQVSDAAGGPDRAAQLWNTFFEKFYSSSELALQKFTALHEKANDLLAGVGLAPDTTIEQFRKAFEKALPTLSPEQVAKWLEAATALSSASDAAGALADALKKGQVDYAKYIADLGQQGAGISSVSALAAARLEIKQWEQEAIKQANTLARAAGLQGASEKDLALIHEVTAHKIAAAIEELMARGADIANRLFRDGQSTQDIANSAASSVRSFGDAMTSAAQAAQSAAQLLLGNLSPLNDDQKLQYALDAYQRGVVNKEDVLQIGRRLFASSYKYTDLFAMLANMPGGIKQPGGSSAPAAQTPQVDRPYQTAEERARERRADAESLSQIIASIAYAQNEKYEDVIKRMDAGFDLADLAKKMGLSTDGLTKYLDNLKAQESKVPDSIQDSADRIIASLYDIAGRTPPRSTGGSPPGISPRDGAQPDIPTGRPNRLPEPRGDADMPQYAVRAPSYPITRPNQTQAAAVQSDQITSADALAELRAVRDRLDSILAATRDGNGRVVEAISETSVAMRDVESSIERTVFIARTNDRRN